MAEELKPIETCPTGHRYNTNKYGDTCPVCGEKIDVNSRKSREQLEEELRVAAEDRVCGWLVCIKGVNAGRSYEIRPGKNMIGSRPNMRIQIIGDPQIAPQVHAVIVYDPRSISTTLLPGSSRKLVYYEGEAIFEPTQMYSHDRMQLGNSEFLFVTLCNEQFDWEQAINEI